jgi:Mrp family chromosome partitioning ATPase
MAAVVSIHSYRGGTGKSNITANLAWEYQIREVRETPNVDLLILNPRIGDPALFDFSHVERNYLRAREVLADTLQNAKLALAFGVR